MDEKLVEKAAGRSSHQPDVLPATFSTSDFNQFGIANLLGMQVQSLANGIGRVSIEIDERLMHPQHIVHGGVIFTLADTAMSMALISVLPPSTPFGTIEAKINYLRPVRSGTLVAEGKIIQQGTSTAVMEAIVSLITGEEQQEIARVLGTFFIRPGRKT